MELSELDDFEGILNLAATSKEGCITRSSPHSAMRKLYLKLSLLIHPDKLGKKFTQATKAFQCLVKALDNLTTQEVVEPTDARSGRTKQKTATIARSNENCFRTRVRCPRCKQPWNEGSLDGNPDYYYNFLMSGLKQYLCSTCLCEFGCMTAIHNCPKCNKQFEYSPSQYHSQITCGHKNCEKPFGFMMFHTSDRVMNDIRASIKQEQEQRLKAREAKARRAARSNCGAPLTDKELEKSFMMGLVDICPRCGEDFTEIGDEEEQIRHLMDCVDEGKHKEHAKKKAEKVAATEKKESLKAKQDATQTHAAWQFLGASDSQLWLLEDDQLRSQAIQNGLDASGDTADLIGRIVQNNAKKEQSSEMTTTTSSGRVSKKRLLLTNDENTVGEAGSSALVTSSRKKPTKATRVGEFICAIWICCSVISCQLRFSLSVSISLFVASIYC